MGTLPSRMPKTSKTPELLAPAGSLEAFFAAMESGADAVYCGLKEFSARAKARNLTLAELEGMLSYARQRGRRIYVTVNTLIKEEELPLLAENLAALEALAVDGVILQDMAVWKLAREHFPGLRLHASTQMTVHNAAGVRMLERMGFSRAVLARELTLEEIAAIRRESRLELEHFVHGALCFSFSGQCYFSSWLGGKSGNRGLCAQPCRRRYRYRQKYGYYFSPNDLSAIDLLPRLEQAGIGSFKIEGRMKSAEYVANVVGAYRLALDAASQDRAAALREAKNLLKQSFGRLPTKGFLTGPHPTDIAIPSLKGATGRFLGELSAVRGSSITFKSRDRLHLGDRLRVQPKSDQAGSAFTLKELRLGRRTVKAAPANSTVIVPTPFHGRFETGDTVFKVSSDRAFTLSEAACRRKLQQAGRPVQPVQLQIRLHNDTLCVAGQSGAVRVEERYPVKAFPASDNPLSEATLQSVFARTGKEPFTLADLQAESLPPVVIPPSRLKEIRRAFYRRLGEAVHSTRLATRRQHLQAALASLLPSRAGGAAENRQVTVALAHLRDSHILNDAAVDRILVPLTGANLQQLPRQKQRLAGREQAVIWDIPFVLLDSAWQECRAAISSLVEQGFRSFRLNNIGHFPLFDKLPEVTLLSGWRLYTLNSQAALAWRDLGIGETTLYLEDDRVNLAALLARDTGVANAMTVYGAVPLITSRIALRGLRSDSPVLSDRGDAFRVIQRRGLTVVQSDSDFSLMGYLAELAAMGCANLVVELRHIGPFSPGGKRVLEALRQDQPLPDTSPFNFERGME